MMAMKGVGIITNASVNYSNLKTISSSLYSIHIIDVLVTNNLVTCPAG
jgi:hypothetical protein